MCVCVYTYHCIAEKVSVTRRRLHSAYNILTYVHIYIYLYIASKYYKYGH